MLISISVVSAEHSFSCLCYISRANEKLKVLRDMMLYSLVSTHIIDLSIYLIIYLTIRFLVTLHLLSNRLQLKSNMVRSIKWYTAEAESVFCDPLQSRSMAAWNLFVYDAKESKKNC